MRRWFLVFAAVAVACGGRATGNGSRTTTAVSEEDPRPESDRGLATFARQDAPPFPVTDFVAIASPIGQPLPPERLTRIAEFIRWYERDPYDPAINRWGQDPMSTRAALMMWVVESPEVHVVATAVLGSMAAQRGEDESVVGGHTTVGAMLGMAAHAIEHPEIDPRDPIRQAEGIASGLRWYEAAVRRGAVRSPFLDELVVIRDHGELASWFAQHVTLHD
jgi:hypothetical protein